jgi:hypothetical protein
MKKEAEVHAEEVKKSGSYRSQEKRRQLDLYF